MSSDFIVDVTEADFEYEVISYSQNTPVIVDFWASWCKPCKTLGPLLENLALEGQGTFRLARVDVDSNPNLALRFGVRSIPTVKAFSQGEIASEFVGIQPEHRIRDFISAITPPSPTHLALEKGNSLVNLHQWAQAENAFRAVLEMIPNHPEALLGLSKSLLGQGIVQETLSILRNFPASKQYVQAESLIPYAESLANLQKDRLPQENDLDITFLNSIRLAGKGNLEAGIDGMLDILRQDKHYRNNLARKVVIGMLELLGEDDPETRKYRNELSNVLF